MRDIFAAHFSRYPAMRPQDAVKLAYQSTYGGGHLISDPTAALDRLKAEYASAPPTEHPPLEEIGGGRSRLYLDPTQCKAEWLYSICFLFVEGSTAHSADPAALDLPLSILRNMTAAGQAPFSSVELERYLKEYDAVGRPMVSHTDAYRAAYRPAYRVMERDLLRLLPVFTAIDDLLGQTDRVTVAIDGMAAAGKSTLGELLQRRYDCALIHMDDFFLPPELRTKERFAVPGGNVHYERFQAQVQAGLASGRSFSYDIFNCHEMTYTSSATVIPKRLTVVEGAYALHPALRELYTLKIFYPIGPQEQLERIRSRNGSACMLRYRDRWIPLENDYIAACGVEACADIVL